MIINVGQKEIKMRTIITTILLDNRVIKSRIRDKLQLWNEEYLIVRGYNSKKEKLD